jgi:hypothetical protein
MFHVCFNAVKLPQLSDPAHGTQRFQPRRSRRVRCGTSLGHWCKLLQFMNELSVNGLRLTVWLGDWFIG